MGLFDNLDSNNLMSLGGMLLSAGAPSTQGVGERLGAGFQQYAAQQKQAGMQALQKKYLEGQLSAQQLAAKTAELENRLKQQDLDIYNQYAPGGSSPQIPSTLPMPGQPPMPLGSLPSGGAPMPIGEMPQGTAGHNGPAQMGPRANLPGQQPPQGYGLPPMPPQYPAIALRGSSMLRALHEANMKQYEAQRQRVLDMAALGKDRRDTAFKEGKLDETTARGELLAPDADPSTQRYAAAWSLLAQPKQAFDTQLGQMVTTRPDMSPYHLPTYRRVPAPGEGAPQTGGVSVTEIAGAGNLSPGQAKAANYADQMDYANFDLNKYESVATDPVMYEAFKKGGWIGNSLLSPEYRMFARAQADFAAGVLRPESGAALNVSDIENVADRYFPRPNDDSKTIEAKRFAREQKLESTRREAGKQYIRPIRKITPEQYEKLRVGALYIDMRDGVTYRKMK
jgi:hypothetical protein